MSADHDLPPLDDEVRGVLEAERARGDVAPDLAARILRGVVATALPAPPTAPPAPKVDPPRSPLRWRVPAWGIPAALVVGAVAGALAVRAQTPPPRPPPVTPLPTVSIVIAAPAAPPPGIEPSALPDAEPSAEPRRRPGAATPSASPSAEPKSDTMPRERALLDVARTAFGKRDPRATIAALEQHRREFPTGKLAEERDALMVEALVEAGRAAEAKERGAEFKAAHPKSILAPAVDDALKGAP